MTHTMETRVLTTDAPLAEHGQPLPNTSAESDAGHATAPHTHNGASLAKLKQCRALTPEQLSQASEEAIRAIRDAQWT
ncbi:MAG: hypothetical protein H7836_05865 [Magnetococcus sp. YQC-3]